MSLTTKTKSKFYKLLRKSEKYTKTDMVYLFRGGFWLTIAKILSALAALLSSIAFANLLPEETYGIFRYVLSVISLLTIPTMRGIDRSLTRAIARGQKTSISTVIRTRIKWGILGGLASLMLGGYYFVMGNNTLAIIFVFSAIFIPVIDPLHAYVAILNGLKKFKLLARGEVITRMSTAFFLIIAVLYTQNILIIIGVYLVSTTTLRYIFLKLSLHHKRELLSGKDTTNEVIKYGKHLSLIGAFGQVSTQLDKILLFHYVGGAALAAYYLSLIPFKQIQAVLGGISTLAFPKFSEKTARDLRSTLPKKIFKLYLVIVPIVIGYIFSAPYIFGLLYPQYMESVLISQFLILLLLFFPITFLNTALTAQAIKTKLYISSSAYAFVRITLIVILVPIYGIYGAVMALLGNMLIYSAVLIFLFLKK